MCKRGDMFSLAILIGRGLDQSFPLTFLYLLPLFGFQGVLKNAPLAQLGEPPKRRRWRMQRGGEVKKHRVMRSGSEQYDNVSEGRAPDMLSDHKRYKHH